MLGRRYFEMRLKLPDPGEPPSNYDELGLMIGKSKCIELSLTNKRQTNLTHDAFLSQKSHRNGKQTLIVLLRSVMQQPDLLMTTVYVAPFKVIQLKKIKKIKPIKISAGIAKKIIKKLNFYPEELWKGFFEC